MKERGERQKGEKHGGSRRSVLRRANKVENQLRKGQGGVSAANQVGGQGKKEKMKEKVSRRGPILEFLTDAKTWAFDWQKIDNLAEEVENLRRGTTRSIKRSKGRGVWPKGWRRTRDRLEIQTSGASQRGPDPI